MFEDLIDNNDIIYRYGGSDFDEQETPTETDDEIISTVIED